MRIRKCWVETCESSAEREQDKGVTFHKLPKDDGLKIKWLIQSRLSEDTDRKHCLVCSRHFRRVDFEALKASTFALKSDAIPTIFPWGITRLEELDSKFSSLDVAPLNTMDVESSVENVGESDAIPNTDLSIDNNDTKDLEKEVVLPKDDAEKLECVDKDVSLTNDLEKMEESSTAAAESLIEMSECSPEVVKPCVNVEIKVENPKPVENITEQEDVKIPCEDTSMSEKQSSKNTVEENMSEMYGEIIDADKDHQDILDPKSTDSPMNECHPIPEIDSIFENLFETHKNAEITSPNISINSVNTEDELKSKSESDEESNKMLKDMISKPMKPISKNQSKVGSVGRPRRRSPLAQKNQIRSKSKSSKQKSTSKSTPDERSLSTGTKSEKGMLVQGSRVEAKDFNDMWYPARVVEVDHDEMEVLIHYDNWSQRFDEWIYMWSPRIRIVDPTPPALNVKPLTYEEGERCLARWSNNQRFPATVQKVLSNGQYEVAFDDGFTRVTKAAMMSKMNAQTSRVSTSTTSTASATRKVVPVTSVLSPTPLQNHLFDPKRDHLGTKEERRSLKKKIDVKELFFARKKKKEIPVSEDTKVNISVTKDGRGRKRKIKPEEDSLIKDPVQKIKKKMESPIKIEPPIKNEVDSEATPPQPDTSQFASSEKHSNPATQISNILLINPLSQSLKIDVPDSIDSPKSLIKPTSPPPIEIKEEVYDEPIITPETSILENVATAELSDIKTEPFDDTVKCETTPSTSQALEIINKSVPLNILGSPTSHALTLSPNPIANNTLLKSISNAGQTPAQTVTSTSTSKSVLTDYLTNSPSNKSISSKFTLRASDRDWCCRWVNDQPVGIVIESESAPDSKSGRVTIQVEDHRLPPGWRKLLTKRCINNSACKWDVVIVCPIGRRYRTRTEMQERLMEPDQNELEPYALGLLDFSAHRKQARRKGWDVSTTSPVNNSVDFCVNMANKAKKAKPVVVIPPPRVVAEVKPPSFHGKDFVFVGALKVQVIDNLLRCPKEGCFKNFRKDNLLQMHIKHYHPEMCKFFGDTPNVADLAYARTVVEESPVLVCKNQFKSEVDKYFDSVSVNRRSDADDESTFNQTWNANQMNSPNALNEANVNYTFTPQGYKDHNVSMEEPNHCPKTSWGETSDVRKNQGVYNYNTSRYFTPRPEVKRSHKKKLPEQLEEARSKKKKIRNFPYAWDTPTTDHDETRSSFGLVDQMGNRSFEHGFTIKTEAHLVKIKEEKEESNHSSTIITETGEKIKIVQMKREEIINCHCGFCEEDGLMIQCELCLCWQHAMCHNIERESEVPEKYVCLICLQPYRGRKSQKYLHDQEWLYEGRLPRASGANPAIDIPRANLLRKSHELTANLLQLKDLMHSLRCKMEVAENKDHPKLYLWSKPWENNLAYNDNNTVGIKSENIDISSMNSINSQSIINTVDLEKPLIPNERLDVNSDSIDTTEKNDKFDQLLDHITEAANNIKDDPEMLQNNGIAEPHLNNGKCDLVNGSVPSNIFSNLLASPGGTSIDLPLSSSELESLTKSVQMSAPQPEAAIESSECRIRLLQHIERTQVLLEARLDSIEAQIAELESQDPSFDDDETPEHFPRTKQTIQMILRDLVTLEELGSIS
ncbi:uncharacterized protein LOC143917202 isoform X1 [Arctopsyche grandis]|uniref:uncharacterized protein LOC143917202 isoform X1 n=1 Tax=Arctopsyche grandis TaxID=121162 RepID=UPI00406D734C